MQLVFILAASWLELGSCPDTYSGARFSSECIIPIPAVHGDAAGNAAGGFIHGSQTHGDPSPPPLARIPGTPAPVVNACRASVDALARPLNPVQVDAVSAGKAVRGPDGILRAPLEIQIIYSHRGEWEVRQSRVECHVDRGGRVVALEGIGERVEEPTLKSAPTQRADATAAAGSLPPPRTDGSEVVEAFYRALGAGDGEAAAQYVVPEKQIGGPLSAGEMSRYFGGLARPLRAQRIVPVGAEQFDVRYSYGIGSRYCAGSARVTLTTRDSVTYIAGIRATDDCS